LNPSLVEGELLDAALLGDVEFLLVLLVGGLDLVLADG
jgi:hypothetical protein